MTIGILWGSFSQSSPPCNSKGNCPHFCMVVLRLSLEEAGVMVNGNL